MAFNLTAPGKQNNEKRPQSAENTTLIMSGMKKISEGEIRPVPFIGHLPAEKQYFITLITGLTFLVLTGLLIILNNVKTSNKTGYITKTSEMQMLTQRISRLALQSGAGFPAAFSQLQQSKDRFSDDLNVLIKGSLALPASPASIQPSLQDLKQQWQSIDVQLDKLIQQKNLLESSQNDISGLAIKSAALNKMLQPLHDRIQTTGSPAQIDQAARLITSSQRIADNIALLNLLITQPAWRSNDKKPSVTAPNLAQGFAALQELKTDTLTVNSALNALTRGDAQAGVSAVSDSLARDRLSEFNAAWQPFERDLGTGATQLQQILALKRTSINPFMNNDLLFEKTRAITHSYEQLGEIGNMFAIVTGLLALISLVAFGFVTLNESKRRVQLSEAENKRNQEAILRLLNELGDLADGDLTANATVTEDITGAIADSINFTIDELRNLVSGINNATEQLTRTTQQAQSISEHLLNAAKLQSEEIVDTSTAMLDMSRSINDVSASANQSANVAVQSLEAAEKGAEAVENAIIGMNSIRENIQETSKRIKRLGESSQEIGEIVELISDITEQTNVLALNAAIQAAAAGEAGRGFSVVAEEVQRLAERSGQATKQIAALVKTIQTDTQDAVSAMEISTQGVVEGARLSDAAGKTLHDIERVSRELAELIRSISIATDNQASTANKVAQAMQQIQNITEQTTAGTQETASSVGELSALASDLKKSVSGFKLA